MSEFSTKRSAMAVAMVVLCRIFPRSGRAVLVVMRRLSLVGCDSGNDLIERGEDHVLEWRREVSSVVD